MPMRASRLRFFMTSNHTPEQIRAAVKATAEEMLTVSKRQSIVERAALAVVAR